MINPWMHFWKLFSLISELIIHMIPEWYIPAYIMKYSQNHVPIDDSILLWYVAEALMMISKIIVEFKKRNSAPN